MFLSEASASAKAAADFTRKSLARFVDAYPSVGLLVCLARLCPGRLAADYLKSMEAEFKLRNADVK